MTVLTRWKWHYPGFLFTYGKNFRKIKPKIHIWQRIFRRERHPTTLTFILTAMLLMSPNLCNCSRVAGFRHTRFSKFPSLNSYALCGQKLTDTRSYNWPCACDWLVQTWLLISNEYSTAWKYMTHYMTQLLVSLHWNVR